ncbi:MAG: hypothetical protein R2848_09515 [Thermomicrobiales bacterium]
MAELEAAGYVGHLHTSGGRVPTDAGGLSILRRSLDGRCRFAGDQIMIRHQFRQAETMLDDWPELAASVLAEIMAMCQLSLRRSQYRAYSASGADLRCNRSWRCSLR